MLGPKKLKVSLLASIVGALILTRLFPFLFGTRIYDEGAWHIFAPSSLMLGPGSMATPLDKAVSLCIDTLVFGGVIFAVWQGLTWVNRYWRHSR
jgi:hypothetical protein